METINSFGRRALLKSAATLAGGAILAPELSNDGQAQAATKSNALGSGPIIVVSDSGGIVETTAGKVRGCTRNGIYTFKGIPFGASTEGAARFMAPTRPRPTPATRGATSPIGEVGRAVFSEGV